PPPAIAIEDITLDTGAFVGKIVRPLLEQVAQLSPLTPIMDVFTEPLPVLNQSLYEVLRQDLVDKGKQTAVQVLDFLVTLPDLIEEARDLTEDSTSQNLKIEFGDLALTETTIASAPTGTAKRVRVGKAVNGHQSAP